MTSSVNKVILVGNLGRDPEVRNTQSGSKIVNLAIATSDTWKDRNTGEKRDRTEWHRVAIFNERVGDVAERYLRKGGKVYIEGELRTRKWKDQQGVEKYTTEVVIAQYRGDLVLLGDGQGRTNGQPRQSTSQNNTQRYQSGSSMSDAAGWGDQTLDDEAPF
ncbi:single-stranded DNA-binding protein [Parasaccharibacter sp. TMW 2.1888]|uniref:single-stranded DNA-binding protein n=1 Tax=Parasaccharibacter sp. TMW 2.1888 TaxID=2268025 RepID=UPI00204C5F35|nr:single-stranded DNA-binding protein [Parasaccharibacter sp. TMW 2.1888]UPO80327.1 single-stranded DNA-binding protein [Parasaccharibacter sp. TMW 2.1888]